MRKDHGALRNRARSSTNSEDGDVQKIVPAPSEDRPQHLGMSSSSKLMVAVGIKALYKMHTCSTESCLEQANEGLRF